MSNDSLPNIFNNYDVCLVKKRACPKPPLCANSAFDTPLAPPLDSTLLHPLQPCIPKSKWHEYGTRGFFGVFEASVKMALFIDFTKEKGQKNGGETRIRTEDTRIFSPLLYQLSYPAT